MHISYALMALSFLIADVYIGGIELLTGTSLAFTVATSNMHYKRCRMPPIIRIITFTILSKIVHVRSPISSKQKKYHPKDNNIASVEIDCSSEVNHNSIRREDSVKEVPDSPPPCLDASDIQLWRKAAAVWDRFFFVLCLLTLILFCIGLLFLLPRGRQGVRDPVIIS